MSDFIRIAGTAYKVFENTATEPPPDLKGGVLEMDDNTLQNSQRDPKRKFACVIKISPPSALDTFLDVISVVGQRGVPTPVSVASDADGLTRGLDLQMWVRAGEAKYVAKWSGLAKTSTMTVPIACREA